MKQILIVIILSIPFSGHSQYLKNGMEWWYSNTESYTDTLKVGYDYFKLIKDTIIDSENCKLGRLEKVNSKRKVTFKKSFLVKEDSSIVYYRYLEDTSWYYLFHNKIVLNGKFNALIKSGDFVKNDTLIELTIINIHTKSILGKLFQSYSLSIPGNRFELYSNSIFTSIGGSNLLFNSIIYNDIADYNLGGPLSCFNDLTSVLKFRLKACDTTIFIPPSHPTTLGTSFIKESEVKISPNPTFGEIHIQFPENLSNYSVSISNIIGENVYFSETENLSSTIDMTAFSTGFYYLIIQNKNFLVTKKIIKQ